MPTVILLPGRLMMQGAQASARDEAVPVRQEVVSRHAASKAIFLCQEESKLRRGETLVLVYHLDQSQTHVAP